MARKFFLYGLTHCEKAAVETASEIKRMMMAVNCAKLLAKSFMRPTSPLTLRSCRCGVRLSVVQSLCQFVQGTIRHRSLARISRKRKHLEA